MNDFLSGRAAAEALTSDMMPAAHTDAGLLAAWTRGDTAAFAALVERYQPVVRAVSFAVTGDRALSEDVAQDALLVASTMHDRMLADQGDLSRDALIAYAGPAGLDAARFTAALDDHRYRAAVDLDGCRREGRPVCAQIFVACLGNPGGGAWKPLASRPPLEARVLLDARPMTTGARHPIIAVAGSALGLLLGGCSADADGGGAPDPTELERATEVVRQAATYVSFDYSANGCHDRSILLAAELAAAGIPSNAQFIVAAGEGDLLTPSRFPGLEWSYHVAPVIYTDDSDPPSDERKFLRIVDGEVVGHIDRGAYILDPALYPDQIAAPLATWVADLTGAQQSGFLSAADAREALDPPSDEAIALERVDATLIPETLEEMPRFWQFQMSSACSFLSRDAQELADRLTAEEIATIRRRMNQGVKALLETLVAQDLVLEVEPISDSPCWDL